MTGLLAEVLAAHGGADRWASLAAVESRLSFGGLAFDLRWNRRGRRERRVQVATAGPDTRFDDYPRPGWSGHFTADRVAMCDGSGVVRAERDRPRAAFSGLRRSLWWDDLDLLYFAGYAVWNYLTSPFLLGRPGVTALEAGTWRERGEVWRRLEVTFPAGLPTHSRRQVFYLDDALRVRRLDYTAEVFARWADAAHYCEDYTTVDGVPVPTRRVVVPRNRQGQSRPGPVLVWARFDGIRFLPRAPES